MASHQRSHSCDDEGASLLHVWSVDLLTPPKPQQNSQRPSPVLQEARLRWPVGPSSWEINYKSNLGGSRLLQFPEEILLKVMRAAEIEDLYMLRQVSSDFWRIGHDHSLHSYEETKFAVRICIDRLQGRWIRDNSPKLMLERRADMVKDGLCSSCVAKLPRRHVKRSDGFPCWSCKAPYYRLLFPPEEREPKSSSTSRLRTCAIHKGTIQLCVHMALSLDNIDQHIRKVESKSSRRSMAPETFLFQSCTECQMPSDENGRPTRSLQFQPPRFSLNEIPIMNPSHMGFTDMGFKLEWCLPVFSFPGGEQISDTYLKRQLEAMSVKYGKVLCPHFEFDDGQLLRAFDSATCCCLTTEYRVGSQLSTSPIPGNTTTFKEMGKEQDTANCFERSQAFLGWNQSTNFLPDPWDISIRNHRVACRLCCTTYSWAREGHFVYLRRCSEGLVRYEHGKITMGGNGIRLMDPLSLGVAQDLDSKHIYWCDDKTCRNRQRWNTYTWSAKPGERPSIYYGTDFRSDTRLWELDEDIASDVIEQPELPPGSKIHIRRTTP